MNASAQSNAVRTERVFRSISYGLVFVMLLCVALAVGDLIQNLLPKWHSNVIAGMLLLVVVDRLYTYRHFKTLTPLGSEWAVTLGVQWIVFGIFIRLLLSYANGLQAFVTDLSFFAHGYLTVLFSAEFVITMLLAIFAWILPGQFLRLLDEIGLDQKLALRDDAGFVPSDELSPRQRLINLTFSLGINLVVLTALARLNLRATLATLEHPADFAAVRLNNFSAGEAGVLLYFLFGLALLAQSRLMSLQTRWNRQRISISSNDLNKQWALYSLLFLMGLAIIVSLLPAGDSLGFLSVLVTVLGFLLGVFVFIAELIVTLILFLFSLPFLLFGHLPPALSPMPPPPVLPTMPVQPALPPANNALWVFIRSLLLWGSLVVILVFSITRFIRQHGSLAAALRQSRAGTWLALLWQWLSKNLDKTRGGLATVIASGWQTIVSRLEGKRILPRVDWISLRSLDPRRQVYFYYLAMIRRGGEQGLQRKPSETPSEYAATLENALPSASDDIDSMTQAFVEARYSRQEVDSQEAVRVKTIWARIRRVLRNKTRSESSEDK